jgi:hypothetical protein
MNSEDLPYHFKKGMVCQFQNGMVSPPATYEAGVHAAGDTKSEHFELARRESESYLQSSLVYGCMAGDISNIPSELSVIVSCSFFIPLKLQRAIQKKR